MRILVGLIGSRTIYKVYNELLTQSIPQPPLVFRPRTRNGKRCHKISGVSGSRRCFSLASSAGLEIIHGRQMGGAE